MALNSAYPRGWGISIVHGTLSFEANCRPVFYQEFVFVDGVFAGTLAPQAMFPRTDGALVDAGIVTANRVYALYDRYGPTDNINHLSDQVLVQFALERTVADPS